jgi:hypothetical protein
MYIPCIYTYPQHTTWFFIEVYFGFFVVSNIYGGGAPKDLLPFIVPGWIKMIIGEITAVELLSFIQDGAPQL